MIKELCEFGDKKRIDIAQGRNIHDALIVDHLDLIISINKNGKFKNIFSVERETIIEDVIRTEDKGRTSSIVPRLIVDNAQYVLSYPKKSKRSKDCHEEYIKKLKNYSMAELKPLYNFYSNSAEGINAAYEEFDKLLQSKQIKDGKIGFVIHGLDQLLNENENVLKAIIDSYEKAEENRKLGLSIKCSICGETKYRSNSISTHGTIKRVPDGQTSGCTLVAYNAEAFESYNLSGNDNSFICTHCIKNYTVGLNWLMTDGKVVQIQDKKGKTKERFIFSQRKDYTNSDTTIIYWTRNNQKVAELDLFDNPDPGTVSHLIESVTSGEVKKSEYIKNDRFYSSTLSGAAARIAVRDWIEMGLDDLKKAIARWFQDIKIEAWGDMYYSPLYRLANCAQNEKSDNKTTTARIASYLWESSLKETAPPLWILTAILKRVRIIENTEDGVNKESITPERAALIRLILNRNKKGGSMLNEKLDTENCSPPYICGRIFAVLESIQRAALGKDINAGIRERFFTFASTNPSSAFGRLMKLTQNHLTKLKNEKAGLAVVLDRELQELISKIQEFPAIFALEEQGQFAIGYYHQKQDTWKNAKSNAELKAATEENINEKND